MARAASSAIKNREKSATLEGVIARSTFGPKTEDAWFSLLIKGTGPVLIVEFKSEVYGDRAWKQAVKYGKRLAERLNDLPFKKKRGLV